ncbi:PH domain-containing protein [Abyssalbus ytuae]|uniref:PH domain-containing protein n=1 Tax=Abyssalbus ytuae TaxID=2926907 RepID=A0A9E6ZPZ6_9FLAO|nr:PH domain-containing protein [Abyssalbus ytuae]UOB18435.1 PH domain-containing protein [Abyssalbus ytuae]
MEEKTIWKGSPSQWSNLMFYLSCTFLIAAFGLGLLLALWKYLDTQLHIYHITNQRIIEHRGILSKVSKEIELYRVKDIQHREPLFLRIFGLSNILLIAADHDSPVLVLKGLENGAELKEEIRMAVDIRRDIKKVREIDFN